MDHEELCSKIFKIDPRVRFVAVFDNSAKRLAGGMREGVKSYLPDSLTKLSVDQSIIRWHTRLKLADWIGSPKYGFGEYEKIRRYTFYLESERILAISTEKDLGIDTIVSKVMKLLGK